ncbi:hypothetical protein L7F22_066852 [Adiantum nelumboides]|nr:hypothetical protein [Adiantum nelumboides]
MLWNGKLGAPGESFVVCLQDESGHCGRGSDDGGDGAETEEDEGAVAFAEVGEGSVGVGAKQVKVADKGQAGGGGRKAKARLSEEEGGKKKADKEGRDEEREDEEIGVGVVGCREEEAVELVDMNSHSHTQVMSSAAGLTSYPPAGATSAKGWAFLFLKS